MQLILKLEKKEEGDTSVKLNGRPVDNLRFADDIDLMAVTKESLQDLTNRVEQQDNGTPVKCGKTQRRWH